MTPQRQRALFLTLALWPLVLSGCKSQEAAARNAAQNEPAWGLERVWPKLRFDRPVDMQPSPDGRIFIVEQVGVIRVFDGEKSADKAEVFLDIRERVVANGEMGLLGLALHPDFEKNGRFYVNYTTTKPLRTIVARFEARGRAADPGSHQIVMEFAQPYGNHNGGQVAFGPDGMLYIAVGDGGAAGDPHNHGQDRSTLLGNILRIDVDKPDPHMKYGIPKDNPFASNNKAWRKEIWAYGLRNPWRISFDSKTGELWTGDVGQNKLEEVDLIVRGGNYGWRTMEGFDCYDALTCSEKGLEVPVVQYPHTLGNSVTGGYVYRGKAHGSLVGFYIYGDFTTGRVWGVKPRKGKAPENRLLANTDINPSSFGLDRRGALYVLDYSGGGIHRLAPLKGAGEGARPPQ